MSAASGLRRSVSSSGLRPQVCSSTFFYLLLHPLFSVHHQLTCPWNVHERCRLGFHVDRNIGVFTATLWYRARHADGQPVVALPVDLHHPVVLSTTAATCSSRRVSTRLHQGNSLPCYCISFGRAVGISNTERLGEIQRAAIPSANARPSTSGTLTAGLLNRENAETVAPASRREGRKLGRRCPYTGAELIVYGT